MSRLLSPTAVALALVAAACSAAPAGSDPPAALGVGSQQYMQPGDVLVSVTEVKDPPDPSGFQQLDGAPRVSRGQLGDYTVPAPAMWLADYTDRGRYFQIGVAFGRERPTDEQFRTANDVLSSFAVRPT
jgi:hypothetical protein